MGPKLNYSSSLSLPQTFNFFTPLIINQSPPINLKLPSFWEDDIELWLAAVDHQFNLSNICTKQRRFSAMLGALDYRVIREIQPINRNQPYQSLKRALIKLCKISDNDRYNRLLHYTDLGDRKPLELLSELRTLLGESCSDNAGLSKLLHKLFLDKLPPQVSLVLAGFPQPTLELTAQRADDIMATMSSAPSLNSNAAQLLYNQMFKRRQYQLTDAVEASLNFRKNNDYGSANRNQQFSRPPQFCEAKRKFSSVPNF